MYGPGAPPELTTSLSKKKIEYTQIQLRSVLGTNVTSFASPNHTRKFHVLFRFNDEKLLCCLLCPFEYVIDPKHTTNTVLNAEFANLKMVEQKHKKKY